MGELVKDGVSARRKVHHMGMVTGSYRTACSGLRPVCGRVVVVSDQYRKYCVVYFVYTRGGGAATRPPIGVSKDIVY